MASELEAAAFRLRRAGQDDLARELTAAMRRGVDPVPDKIRAGLGPHLPDRYAADPRRGPGHQDHRPRRQRDTDAVVTVYRADPRREPEAASGSTPGSSAIPV